jgi:hypothetical protein
MPTQSELLEVQMNEKSQNNSTLLTPEAPKALDVEDVLLRAPLYTAYAWNDYPDCINYLYRFDIWQTAA